ncbi:MAG: hypothetical protein RI885_1343 [Actinomycetota bacterium]|jgi:hypothetical protein
MRAATAYGRLSAAALGTAALSAHLSYSLGSGGSALGNFFSYFTMQSAIAATVLWVTGGVIALGRADDPRWLGTLRLLTTAYQLVSGGVYTVIVIESVSRGLSIQVPLSSQILHYWMPVLALVDWLVSPGRVRPRWRVFWSAFPFPLAWAVFTMARGAAVGWYPYFFLDPYQLDGVGEFVGYAATVLTVIGIVALALIASGRVLPPSVRQERLQARPHQVRHLGVVELGESQGVPAADGSDEHR